jgi:uncharacterized protein YcsI (UPF0317 family)
MQTNLAILPERYAFDFLRFCQHNPKACPVVDVTDPGDPEPRIAAPGADIRTDLPRYRIWRDGGLAEEVTDLRAIWRRDHVAFLLGCSFTFDDALRAAGMRLPHLERPDTRLAVYRTNIPCTPAGIFSGPMVVSMRAVPAALVGRAVEISARYPLAHGSPVHVGDPAAIGIADLAQVDYGGYTGCPEGHLPMFWGCGVTPQAVTMASGIPEMITHAPGHMFVTDLDGEGRRGIS